jgi:hypothetical protein
MTAGTRNAGSDEVPRDLAELRPADGMFLVSAEGELTIGHVDAATDVWRISPLVAQLLISTAAERPARLVPAGIGEDQVAAAVQVLLDAGLLVSRRAVPTRPPPPRTAGFELLRHVPVYRDLAAVDPDFLAAYELVRDDTFVGVPLSYALWGAVRHVVAESVPGAVVEAGVWRGGSMLLAAFALLGQQQTDRELWMYDTFEWSWDPPGAQDGYTHDDADMRAAWVAAHTASGAIKYGGVEENHESVLERVAASGYPRERIFAVPGLVQDTIPDRVPERIAVLRLDTDQYESTLHELTHLYPRVSPGGIIVVDDYGKHAGATRAVDDYFSAPEIATPFLVRVDIQGRIAIKPGPSNGN